MKFKTAPLTLVLALAAPAAFAADDVYQSTMPDGKKIYGDSPAPGAKSVRKVPPPQASGATVVTREEQHRMAAPAPEGGVSVIPLPKRASPEPHQQGKSQGGTDLPKRSY